MGQVFGFERGDDGVLRITADQAFAAEMAARAGDRRVQEGDGTVIDWGSLAATGSYPVVSLEGVLPLMLEDQYTTLAGIDPMIRYGRPDLGEQPNI